MKHDLLSFSFAMDDILSCFRFGITSTLASSRTKIYFSGRVMEVIKETLWKRCLSTPTKPPVKNSNICLSETAYQHKRTRKKCKKTIPAAIIQWQRHRLMYKPHHIASPDRSRKQASFLRRGPVHCITPFCSDALVSPPNLYPPWLSLTSPGPDQ